MKMLEQKNPDELAIELLRVSIGELKFVTAQFSDRTNLLLYQLLLPTHKQGLYNAMTAYRELLAVRNIVVPMGDKIKQMLDDYANEWRFLFDAVRKLDKQLSEFIDDARESQKEVHKILVAILGDGIVGGKDEYEEFVDFLTILSEEMSERAEAIANKKSTKGQKYDTYKIKISTASRISGIPAVTLYRQVKKDSILRMVLNADTVYPFLHWAEEYLKIHKETKIKKHETNMMNHALIESNLTEADRKKYGFN